MKHPFTEEGLRQHADKQVLSDAVCPPEDLPELDDLLTTKSNDTAPVDDEADGDDLPDLVDLLSESVEQAKEARAVKEAAERRKRGGALSEEDLARLREWEARHEWRDIGNTALFCKYHCNGCGRNQTIFMQLLRHQEHRHMKETFRWTATTEAKTDLPNEVAVQKFVVGMCTNCCVHAGFEFKNVREWEA